MTGRLRLDQWADLARLDPHGLAALLGPLDGVDVLEALIALGERLPRGLIHADAVHVVAHPPQDRAPLAPGSDWYALDRALAVVLDDQRPDALADVLEDLGLFARVSRHLFAEGTADPELIEAAAESHPAEARLLAVLGTHEAAWRRVDEQAPGLRDDLLMMFKVAFDAPIHLHPHVRPGWLAQAGQAWAEQLSAQYPVERPWLFVSDGPALVELLSPYARDLTAALGQWALENPEQIRLPGLRSAWGEAPDEDLAAMVVPDLFRADAELLEERRANERCQGLFIEDRLGAQAGFVEIGRLAAPDRRAVPAGASGTALVLAGGPRALRVSMLRHWLGSEVAGVAATFIVGTGGSMPIVPEVFADPHDAFVLPGTPDLRTEASTLSVELSTPEVLDVRDDRTVAAALFGRLRRQQLCGHLDPNTPVFAAFMPQETVRHTPTVAHRRAAYDATRLVLRRALHPHEDPISHRPKVPRNPGNDSVPRRFRA